MIKGTTPVLVLNWNGWNDTFQCLASLAAVHPVPEVWLIDNNSGDDRTPEARDILAHLRVIRLDANYGFAGGYNRALSVALAEGYETVFLLNNDTNVTDGFLAAAAAVMEKESGVAAVGSTVLAGDGRSVEYDGTFHPQPFPERVAHRGEDYRILVPPEHPHGAAMLLRLAAGHEHGLFDERLFCYGEEAEWSWRLAQRGLPSAVSFKSLVLHKGGGSDRNSNARYYRLRNALLLSARQPAAERLRNRQRILYEAGVLAGEAYRNKDMAVIDALSAAVTDGLRGSFGRRPDAVPGRLQRLRLRALWLRAHLHDKWRRTRGRLPGYGRPVRWP